MDLHPVFVHFPIALLTVYALLEMARVRWFTQSSWWVPVKTAFVILGALGSVAAYASGWLIQRQVEAEGAMTPVMAMHSTFAWLTLLLFGLIGFCYVITICRPLPAFGKLPPRLAQAFTVLAQNVLQPAVVVPLALIGLVLVTVTGALGGAMVYGTEGDPIVRIVTEILL